VNVSSEADFAGDGAQGRMLGFSGAFRALGEVVYSAVRDGQSQQNAWRHWGSGHANAVDLARRGTVPAT
jgi:hypothetical protein